MNFVLLTIILIPTVTGIWGLLFGKLSSRTAIYSGGLCWLLTLLTTIEVTSNGAISTVILSSPSQLALGFYVDRTAATLLLLIFGVGTVVQVFAANYLRGDIHANRFFAASTALIATVAATVCAQTLLGLTIAWTLSSVTLCLALNLYPRLPSTRQGVRRTATAFMIGDIALWVATALVLKTWGNIDLRQLPEKIEGFNGNGLLLTACSMLILIAALARSAQFPFGKWLPATLSAPTPVSALLHAGVVNGGGILLIRLAPLFGASPLVCTVAFAVGGATAVYATAIMLSKPDIKGALAYSTMGQMGFMMMTCGLGAFTAALFHLVAHGMYKATLFLGSGSALHNHIRHAKAPPKKPLTSRGKAFAIVVSITLPATMLFFAFLLLHPDVGGNTGSGALLIFAWATASRATWGLLSREPKSSIRFMSLLALGVAAWLYVGWFSLLGEFFTINFAASEQTYANPWLLVPVVATFAIFTAITSTNPKGRLQEIHDTLYVRTLQAGSTPVAPPTPTITTQTHAKPTLPFLNPQSEGAS